MVDRWLMVAEFVMVGRPELDGSDFAKIPRECGMET